MKPGVIQRRRGPLGIPGVSLVGSVLVLAVVVNALVVAQQPATVTPTPVLALPVTLTAVPLTGTTVTAGTVATTTGITPLLTATTTVNVARLAPHNWDVVLAVTSTSGITGGETLLVAVGAQILSLDVADTYPLTTSAVTLGATGLTVTVATTSLVFGCHTCAVNGELRISPPGASQPMFIYPYTITTAA